MRQVSRRRRLSLTSLIDVIFLLLLFFMLSSTFTRFAEVELSTGGGATGEGAARIVFAQLDPARLRIDGTEVRLADVAGVLGKTQEGTADASVLLALSSGVTAQRLTDALGAFRGIDGLSLTVLGGS